MTANAAPPPLLDIATPMIWKYRTAAGPALTGLFAAALLGLRAVDIHVPNPVLFFVNTIVFAAFLGGTASGLASVAITLCFTLFDWSLPHQWLRYTPRDAARLVVLGLTMPPLALLVGWLRGAYDRNHREIVRQRDDLARELKRREALEATQRDVEHILRHDLRAPLGGIIAMPQMLCAEDNLTAKQKSLLAMISAVGRKMLGQINGSLELRRIEEGSYALSPQPCDPAAILRENFDILTAGGYATPAAFELRDNAHLALHTDPLLLDSILANLLRNALEANDAGSPVTASLEREGDDYVITFKNSRAVPLEARERFFEKYVTAGKIGGTGLGTYSAALMARALGGSIDMQTSDETGTTVTVRLPATPA